MMTEDAEQKVELVTLPAALINNPATVELWYQKYVPEGHLIVDIEPVEKEPAKSEHVGFGDSLDFVGEEPVDEGLKKIYEDLIEVVDEGDDESEEDDDGESFVDESAASPKADV
jgi:hypothetical protein